ncbi:uncharacterized protein L203_105452 [Cryptococcus depauperatus CBS 7841]|uniref:Uncharacterized protein n=1 Tax=Cryptococcus depauperatus CBS 7841 TaxID=1295531 RepID=A0AAJ8JX90_9TREE
MVSQIAQDNSKPPPASLERKGLPANGITFNFACHCLNIKLDARIAASDELVVANKDANRRGRTIQAYLPNGSEGVKFIDYVIYESEVLSSDKEISESAVFEEDSGKAWRKCCICNTRVYRSNDKQENDQAAEEEWVDIELDNGIMYGEDLDNSLGQDGLPFSGLLFSIPTTESAFGRPPTNSHSSIDPNAYLSSNGTRDSHYIIPPHDPFFLPPPFIPAHPVLKDLCDGAESYVREQHKRLEDHVWHFVSFKTLELRNIEEKVRSEIEFLWKKYQEGPGREDIITHQRSASISQTRESRRLSETKIQSSKESKATAQKSFQPAAHTENPILQSATSPSTSAVPNGTSLLAQSLSQSTFYPPQSGMNVDIQGQSLSTRERDEIDDTIHEVAKIYNTKDDSRAVAMSYVFSSLADNINLRPARDEPPRPESNGHKRVSWIDEETANTNTIERNPDGLGIAEEEREERTPRPKEVKHLYEEEKRRENDGKREKGRGRVTFEEPKKPRREESYNSDQISEEGYVFDFELEGQLEAPIPIDPYAISHLPSHHSEERQRNLLEANLSHTFAADLPSHRAAWHRIEQNGSMYEALRRERPTNAVTDDNEDESRISKLATSVPIAINPIRIGRANTPVVFERKTSLADRQGILMPPLKAAMREKHALPLSGSLGFPSIRGRLATERQSPRSASRSRERERLKSYTADPGPIFEALGDAVPDEEEESGTMSAKMFIPPHVLARREESRANEGVPEVGWRSMAS